MYNTNSYRGGESERNRDRLRETQRQEDLEEHRREMFPRGMTVTHSRVLALPGIFLWEHFACEVPLIIAVMQPAGLDLMDFPAVACICSRKDTDGTL